jgi:hypothetical protein
VANGSLDLGDKPRWQIARLLAAGGANPNQGRQIVTVGGTSMLLATMLGMRIQRSPMETANEPQNTQVRSSNHCLILLN